MANTSKASEPRDTQFDWVFYAVVAGVLGLTGLTFIMSTPAIMLYKFDYWLISHFPIISYLMTQSQYEAFMHYQDIINYKIADLNIRDLTSSALSIYQIPFVISSIYWTNKYLQRTRTFTIRKPVKELQGLMDMRKKEYSISYDSYIYQTHVVNNPKEQLYGYFSQELGPIRWAIKNEIISHQGSTLTFKKSNTKSSFKYVEDNFEDFNRYNGELDVDLIKLRELYKKQLGKKFSDIWSLETYKLALCAVFLLYAKEKKDRKAAKDLLTYVMDNITIIHKKSKNQSTVKETISRKKIHAIISKEISSIPALSYDAVYENEFILDLYNNARLKNADITPPEYNKLISIDRELFLLLHAYSDPNHKCNNSSYIEVQAPMQNWVRFDDINRKYTSSAIDFETGKILIEDDNLFKIVLNFLYTGKILTKEKSLKRMLKKTKQPVDLKEVYNIVDKLEINNFHSLVVAIIAEALSTNKIDISTLLSIQSDIDNDAFYDFISYVSFLYHVSKINNVKPNDLIKKVYNKKYHFVSVLKPNIDTHDSPTFYISDNTFNEPFFKNGYNMFKSRVNTTSKLTLDQRRYLLLDTEHTIESCVIYFLFHMTTIEKWLTDKYITTEEDIQNFTGGTINEE